MASFENNTSFDVEKVVGKRIRNGKVRFILYLINNFINCIFQTLFLSNN